MYRSALLIVAAGMLLAADAPKDGEVEKALAKLQGKWVATALVQNGKEVPPETLEMVNLTLEIKGSKFTVVTPKETKMGTIRVTPGKKPAHLDWIGETAEGKKETTLGIYEWDGASLRLAADKNKRPSEFKSEKGGSLVMTLKKVKE